MQKLKINYLNNLRDEMYDLLNDRKNLMFYDGIRDGLDDNIECKFFYSSPHDPLEFINIDIFNEKTVVNLNGCSEECFGTISIIKDVTCINETDLRNVYGKVNVDYVDIRGINKQNIKLFLNNDGISKIKDAIEYFENELCKKGK